MLRTSWLPGTSGAYANANAMGFMHSAVTGSVEARVAVISGTAQTSGPQAAATDWP